MSVVYAYSIGEPIVFRVATAIGVGLLQPQGAWNVVASKSEQFDGSLALVVRCRSLYVQLGVNITPV